MPTGLMNLLELMVEFIRDSVAQPNIGAKWTNIWTPLLLTLFVFILGANVIGLIPIFEVARAAQSLRAARRGGLVPRHGAARRLHGDRTSTSRPAWPSSASSPSSSPGPRRTAPSSTGRTWCRTAVAGAHIPLIPIEIIGMFVRPFALTMRLAANMTGGHIAILAIMSFVFIFTEMAGQPSGMGVGSAVSVPLAVGVSGLEIIVVLVQAYVFTLLSAVFIGMAINAHH